jgi:hypothetical protein
MYLKLFLTIKLHRLGKVNPVDVISILRAVVRRSLLGFIIILSLLATPAFPVEYQDSQIFISGFNAYQSKDYQGSIDKMTLVLQKYPDTPLRDMAIFWLARANFKAGNRKEAAKYMAQFYKEYPDSPLKSTVEPELSKLAVAYAKGEPLPAAGQTEEEKALTAKAAAEKSTAVKLAAEKAETDKAAAALAEADKLAAEKTAAEKAAADRAAAEKAAADKLAADRAVAEKAAADKLAADRAVTEKAAADKLATDRAAAEKAAADKLAADRAAAEKAAADKLAADRAAVEKTIAEKAAAEKAAADKLAADKTTAKKAEADRLAAEKAAARKAAAEKLVTEKAARKAAAEKLAAEKAAARKAAAEKLVAEKAARKAAAVKLAAEKAAAKKAAAEKLAAEKEAARQTAAIKLAAERAAVEKAETERLAAEKAAAETAWAERVAAEKSAAEKAAREKMQRQASAVHKAESSGAMHDKAIAGYKAVIDRYPGSRAAAVASAKLKKMGTVYPPAVYRSAVAVGGNAQVMTLEVEQFADFAVTMAQSDQIYAAGKRFSIPFEVVNRGNGLDVFSLESGFPSEFDVRFASQSTPDISITSTPQLVPGEVFKGVLTGAIPRSNIDGQKSVFPIKVVSRFAHDLSQSREISLVASAPLLRAVIKPDRGMAVPGEKVAYHIALLNAGSANAENITLRLDHSPLYEPVDFISSGFRQGAKGDLVIDSQRINSGESRDFTIVYQVKDRAAALQELTLRGNIINPGLERSESFLSAATVVQGVSGVAARANTEKIVAIPGQTITIPITVTNTGNMRETFRIKSDALAGLNCRFFNDQKHDGKKIAGAPSITSIGPLEPREDAYLLMELITSPESADGSDVVVRALFEPDNDKGKNANLAVNLRFARPIVELSMSGKGSKLKPGEISSFDFNVVNRGSNLAKYVEIRSILPGNLELLDADIAPQKGSEGEYIWKFVELGAGEKRSVKVTYRVKAGIPVGTNIQIKNLVTYEDQLGNRY